MLPSLFFAQIEFVSHEWFSQWIPMKLIEKSLHDLSITVKNDLYYNCISGERQMLF